MIEETWINEWKYKGKWELSGNLIFVYFSQMNLKTKWNEYSLKLYSIPMLSWRERYKIIEKEIYCHFIFSFLFFFFIARKLNCGKRRFPIKRLCISHWKPILYNFVKSLFFYNFSHSKLQDEVLWSFFLKTYVLWANLKNHMNREQWKKQSELREKRSRRHFLISFFSPKDLTFCYNTVFFLF